VAAASLPEPVLHASYEIIAHRGFSARAPENTVASLEAALAAGAEAVEFDVQVAACGTPVLFHDAMLSRTTDGVGPLRKRTLAQLKQLDAGSWYSNEFVGETIPSLPEALTALRRRVKRVYLEVKGFRELEDVDRMVAVVHETGMSSEVVYISLNWTTIDRVRGQDPQAAVGYVIDHPERCDEAFERARGDARALLDFRASLILDDPRLAERAVRQNSDTAVWTVDDPVEAGTLAGHGIRRFTTNQVGALLAWVARRER